MARGMRLLAVGAAALVALGLVGARKQQRSRRKGADTPGRRVSVAESVLPVARDPAEVIEDLVPSGR
jgi:hypothetical protein